MKAILLLAIAISIVGCGSSDKKSTPAAPASKSAAASAPSSSANNGADQASKKPAKVKSAKAAAPAETATGSKVVCSSGTVKREIDVVIKEDHCSVEYTKDGASKEIATGALASSHCKDVQEKVKGNLASAGYSCE